MLLAHTDVVPAPSAGWSVGPFDGTVRDGLLVGRGAADMKGELAARAVALAAFARSGERPAGDVVLVAEADEERNTADVGLSWLVRERPDLRCDYALNEGGGVLLELADGRRVVTVAVGEKQVTSLRLRVHGTAGHASVPAAADNPLRHAATAVERLLAAEAPMQMTPVVARALEALGAPADLADAERLRWARDLHPILADLLPPITRLTVTPTGAADARARERDPAVRRRDLRLPRAPRPVGGRHHRPHRARRSAPGSSTRSSCSSRSRAAPTRRSTRRSTESAPSTSRAGFRAPGCCRW